MSDVEGSILENNLFGVDLNEESVEIAKLSLWLRTAQPHRKLNDLSNNIKCGNSLIDDPAVAGDKAFNWQHEFPHIFNKGGFDVVIGNPPYLRVQGINEHHNIDTKYFQKSYQSARGRYDLYILFIEQSLKITNKTGKISFILPHNFINGKLGIAIRELLTMCNAVEEIVHFGSFKVFHDASTYTCILTLSSDNKIIRYKSINPANLFNDTKFEYIEYNETIPSEWNLNNSNSVSILKKINKSKLKVKDVFTFTARGTVTGADDIFIMQGTISGKMFTGFSKFLDASVTIESDLIKPILMGNSIERNGSLQNQLFVLYPHTSLGNKTVPLSEDELRQKFPKTFGYLLNFKDYLIQKKIKYKTNPDFWFSLHNSRDIDMFESRKIITPYLANYTQMALDECGEFYTNDKCSSLVLSKKYFKYYLFYLPILNSKLHWFYVKNISSEFSGGYFAFTNLFLNTFSIPKPVKTSKIVNLTQDIIDNNYKMSEAKKTFQRTIQRKFNLEDLPKKLQDWYKLSYGEFIKELGKKKVKLSLAEEAEWEEYFLQEQKKALQLKATIDTTDKEIDQIVYELYGLTPEEIEIVENS